jgi:hypothetical protein
MKIWLGDIEIRNRRNITKRVIDAINNNRNVVYNGIYVVNIMGGTIYISLDFLKTLTIEQIEEILQKTL